MKINNLNSRKILDSRSEWTIETKMILEDGSEGIASVPGGESKGEGEAKTLSVESALNQIEKVKSQIVLREFGSPEEFDRFLIDLDGTEDKSRLGGNTILSLSVAFGKAAAVSKNLNLYQYLNQLWGGPLPEHLPQQMVLIFEGGKHGSGKMKIQEFMVVVDNIGQGDIVYDQVRSYLTKNRLSTTVGLEGGFSPEGIDDSKALRVLTEIGEKPVGSGLSTIPLALDVAASSYEGKLPDYAALLSRFPNIVSIEDPFPEDSWEKWVAFTKEYGDDILIVADDLTTTDPAIIKKAIQKEAANAVIIKPNQIGTVTETIKAVNLAQKAGWEVVVSHRGGETNDTFIADLAVGVGADFVKFGAPSRGERVAKYNRLLEIERKLAPRNQTTQ